VPNVLKSWELQNSGVLGACLGLYKDSFTCIFTFTFTFIFIVWLLHVNRGKFSEMDEGIQSSSQGKFISGSVLDLIRNIILC
jgi:hypothetical protein